MEYYIINFKKNFRNSLKKEGIFWLHEITNKDWSINSFIIEKYNNIYEFCKLKQKYDYIQNLHITITKKNDFPIQEKYKNTSHYSLSINFDKTLYKLWDILINSFIVNSDLFNKPELLYGISYSCKKEHIIIKLLYKTSEELDNVFNINSNDYKKYLQQSNFNLKYRFVK
tara:strand:- start:1874 stop:2383 length:510 start_codon:yes stop_codon:yes gene_type:complete